MADDCPTSFSLLSCSTPLPVPSWTHPIFIVPTVRVLIRASVNQITTVFTVVKPTLVCLEACVSICPGLGRVHWEASEPAACPASVPYSGAAPWQHSSLGSMLAHPSYYIATVLTNHLNRGQSPLFSLNSLTFPMPWAWHCCFYLKI